RLREPTAGRVLLEGVDLRDLGQDEVRRAVSGCRQEPWLFATTLHDNLLLARPSAIDAEVTAAAQAAGLSERVAGLPEGWATRTGEAGAMESGGQAQRLALARALLHDPRVLLLDEPTAGLECELADHVLADVLQAATGRTLLVVTHRLRGLDAVDEVVVLDRGRVVQRGPADQLRNLPGLFRDLELAEREADALLDLQPRMRESIS
ncbi:MAG: ATP-binding cassette domain-containing protein, partial [Frankiales bacterium]|nr:ATP-binding cassette domain-containing protein [Frankiales bacterium]